MFELGSNRSKTFKAIKVDADLMHPLKQEYSFHAHYCKWWSNPNSYNEISYGIQ